MVKLDKSFIKSVSENYPKNKDKILEAYKFASKMHDGAKRKSGEPYIIHPVAIAQILIDNNMDYSTIMAGLLHDVVEDTAVTLDDIRKKFGDTVAKLVDGVTKIDEIKLQTADLNEEESIKHLLIAMGNDLRVIFIKLADRLHNMKTVEFLKREKQIRMANETQELFIPIAERIGVRKLRAELQSLTFKCLHPDEYNALKGEINEKLEKYKEKIEKIEANMQSVLKQNGINCKIISWPERTYSVYKKKRNQGQDISKVYTLMLYRLIVPTEEDCYKAMGLIHKLYRPVPGQITDNIAVPKANGFKSLHTVLTTQDSELTFKVMIRTPEMDNTCEFGISSYWQNKDSDIEFKDEIEQHNSLKQIILGQTENYSTTSSFIDAIKTDLNSDSTWVLTPKLNPICINAVSPTAIDFAYAVHTKIGNNAISAVVNGKKVSLGALLKRGDVVEIVLSKKDKAPCRNWLMVVKTANARKRIREFINKNTTPENIEKGKQMLAKELAKFNYGLTDVERMFSVIQPDFNFENLNDLYASVGYESVTVLQISNYIIKNDLQKMLIKNSPVEVKGFAMANIIIPKCCCPVYGDDIVGVCSKNGVTVHTNNCINLKNIDKAKLVETVWKQDVDRLFDVNLKIVSKNSLGYASKILGMFASENVNISKIVAKEVNGNNDCEFDVCVAVKNNTELQKLIEKIKLIPEVKTVNRFFE